MKVILKEDVKNLGAMGDVVNVTPGYARNFLFPKGLAADADVKNIKALEHEKRVIEERRKKLVEKAQGLAGQLSSVTVGLKAKAGEEGKLFGSITSKDIAEALAEKGYEVDRRKIVLEEPIKRVGSHQVAVKLGHDVTATVTVEVEAE
ncbi:MAG: 50S ribosomal protein L9 [Thermodesulfovibrionales bacterium]